VARFDEPHASSDAGAVLLKAADRTLGLVAALTAGLRDDREASKVTHELADLVAQRVFGIACGYADANDAARLGNDPIHKLLLDRDPIDGQSLASQPTLSRFENAVGAGALYRMGQALADRVIERHRRRRRKVRRITVDLDPTDDPTHGAQQLALFNGHYDCWCYLPLLGFLTFDHEPEQYLVAAVLRPGNAPASQGARTILWRLLEKLSVAFPQARILVRLDGGFATPELLEFLDETEVDYVVAMGQNSRLKRFAETSMRQARRLSQQTGETAHLYGEARYQAKTWARERRVIFKAEVVRASGKEPRDNPRFVLTNLKASPRFVYEKVYCERGDSENRIKELHHGLELDRTSCHRFQANQFRVLLTAAAYVLMQEIRLRAAGTALACAQVSTLREALFKLGAWIEVSVRRVVMHLPISVPYRAAWNTIAFRLGARAG
jgi:hypothetical protein